MKRFNVKHLAKSETKWIIVLGYLIIISPEINKLIKKVLFARIIDAIKFLNYLIKLYFFSIRNSLM